MAPFPAQIHLLCDHNSTKIGLLEITCAELSRQSLKTDRKTYFYNTLALNPTVLLLKLQRLCPMPKILNSWQDAIGQEKRHILYLFLKSEIEKEFLGLFF